MTDQEYNLVVDGEAATSPEHLITNPNKEGITMTKHDLAIHEDEVQAAQTSHKSIAAALATAQLEMGKAKKDSKNPHFKSSYADLASVMDACMNALNAAGIAVIQPVVETEFSKVVLTKFLHTSGESVECAIPIIMGKQDMQGLGSAITYARRYGLMSLAGVAPYGDDGNAAAATPPKHRSWAQTITDELPAEATDREKAQAVANALCAQWKRKKTQGELNNEWDRRSGELSALKSRFPDMHETVVEAFEVRMVDVEPQDASKAAAQ